MQPNANSLTQDVLKVLDMADRHLSRGRTVHVVGLIDAALSIGLEEAHTFRERHLTPRHQRTLKLGRALRARNLTIISLPVDAGGPGFYFTRALHPDDSAASKAATEAWWAMLGE
jgi:hypothetical protein